MQGWMKYTKLLSKPSGVFWGSMKCTKLVIGEMYEMGRKISKPSTCYYFVLLHKQPHDIVVCVVSLFLVDTGHKLSIQKTLRSRLGLLPNVLCTFSLRPVSTGLRSLNMSTQEFALSQLLQHKLFLTSGTHVYVVVLVVQVVCVFGMYKSPYSISHKTRLYTLSLQYE